MYQTTSPIMQCRSYSNSGYLRPVANFQKALHRCQCSWKQTKEHRWRPSKFNWIAINSFCIYGSKMFVAPYLLINLCWLQQISWHVILLFITVFIFFLGSRSWNIWKFWGNTEINKQASQCLVHLILYPSTNWICRGVQGVTFFPLFKFPGF